MTDALLDLLETLGARFSLAHLIDIFLVAGLIHVLLKLIEGRRASQMAFGTAIVGGLLLLTGSGRFGLTTLQWIVREMLPLVPIAIIVLYQSEIRIGLARIGRTWSFLRRRRNPLGDDATLRALVKAATELSRRRQGAIVVWQGTIGLRSYADTGTLVNARLGADLLVSIFHKASPLHDGAVIVSGSRIVAARCVLPLSRRDSVSRAGTRHRAAMGVAEETDATVVVVSEETGQVSLVSGNRIRAVADPADLEAGLKASRPMLSGSRREDAVVAEAAGAAP